MLFRIPCNLKRMNGLSQTWREIVQSFYVKKVVVISKCHQKERLSTKPLKFHDHMML
jgi:hypothetical protein